MNDFKKSDFFQDRVISERDEKLQKVVVVKKNVFVVLKKCVVKDLG